MNQHAPAAGTPGKTFFGHPAGLGTLIDPSGLPWRLHPENHMGPVPIAGAALMLFAALHLTAFAALLTTPLVQWFGRLSFSLYLVHVPLLYTLVAWAYVNVPLPEAVLVAGYFVLTFALAHLFTLAVDEPSLSFLRVLRRWLRVGKLRRSLPAGD